MFSIIKQTIQRDNDLPPRSYDLTVMERVLDGALYDGMRYEFCEERSPSGEYIEIRKRRPSVRYNLCSLVVHDSVALLFGEGRFPQVECGEDVGDRVALGRLVRETYLNAVMIEAAIRGSVGSRALLMRILKGRVFFESASTVFMTPIWRLDEPDVLASVVERRKAKGSDLRAAGYQIADDMLDRDHWFQRVWTDDAETWFAPIPASDDASAEAAVDEERTVRHNLGFVPVVWIRNLPGGGRPDGACTFRPAIETQIELEYQLSQAGRGLKYSSDPTLLIKEPAAADSEIIKSAGNALVVSEKGDAKLLEISGTASDAVIAYAKTLRELALEQIHGNRSNADRVTAAQSGRAMELMHQPLIWLADNLRISYGENGILPLLRMAVAAAGKMELRFRDGAPMKFNASQELTLRWPPFFEPTSHDRLEQAQALTVLTAGGVVQRLTATMAVAEDLEIIDPAAESAAAAAEMATNVMLQERTP